MRRICISAITICLLLLVSLFLLPQKASAATDGYFTYKVENGKSIITDVSYSASGSVTVPDTLGGYPVTVIGDRAFKDCAQLEYVFIPDSVTTIGISAFENCTKLWSFNINGYGSITTIGNSAFWGCSELMHITIPDTITSIGKNAFALCNNLYYNTYDDAKYLGNGNNNYLILVDYEASSTKSCTVHSKTKIIYDEAFQNCASVTGITIPDSVTTIGAYAFYGCSRLTSISLGNGITSIGETAFYNCEKLQYNLYDNAKYLGNSQNPYLLLVEAKDRYITSCTFHSDTKLINSFAFDGCTNLTSVAITNSVMTVGTYAFRDCRSMTSLIIGNGVKSIGDSAFSGCSELTGITISDSVTAIGASAFSNCSKLQSVNIGKGVTTIGTSAFGNCSSLKYFDVNYYNTAYSNDGYYVLYNKDKTILIQAPQKGITGTYTIPGTVDTIVEKAFYNCAGLTKVIIPDGVVTIGNSAFYNCTGLTDITIPDSVTTVGEFALSGCSSLETVTIPFVGNSRKTASDLYQYPFGYIFGHYSYAGSIETQQKYYGSRTSSTSTYYAYIPQSLKSVTVTGGNILAYAFSSCNNLTNVTIADSVTSIGSSAFSNCSGLTSITIPDSVTSIGSSAFFCCSSLNSITIPAAVTTIDNYAFQGCKGLMEIWVDENNTAFCTDAYGVLYNKDMTTLLHAPASLSGAYTVSNSVTTIKDTAFSSSGVITHVAFAGTETQWNNISIGFGNTSFTNATRHYETSFQNVDNCVETGVYCTVCEAFIIRTEKENGAHSYTDNDDLSCNACDFSRTAAGISVSQLPQKLSYLLLEELDITGGKLLLNFDDGSSVEIAMTTHIVEGFEPFQTGEQQLTVTYAGLTTTFTVQVESRVFDALQIMSLPDKQNYLVGENLDMAGLVLNAVFGDQACLLDSSHISAQADLSTSGMKTVTLTYENVQTTYPVYVHEREVITVDSSLYPESEHNYASDLDDVQTLTVPGASYLTITFDSDCYTENFYDIVYVLDGQGIEIGTYHGSFGGTVVTVPGDTVQIRLVSDDGKNFYGYKIASIEADAGIFHPEINIEGYAPTCTEEGLTDGTGCAICGQVIVPQQPISATGHSHGQWMTVKPATFTAEGLREKTCVFCGGDPITEAIAVLVGKVSRWNVALADDLLVNFHLTITESIEKTAKVRIYVGENAYTFSVSELEKTEDGLYIAQVSAAAAQMNDLIYVSVINNGSFNETAVYTIRQYADTILADESHSRYHTLVREMLSYGAAAQVYFDYEADNLANSGITGTGTAEIPDTVDHEVTLTGKANGVTFYGASLIFRDRISVRYYFEFVGAIKDCAFAANGKTYAPQLKDGLYYIEIEDILPQDLDKQITLTVTDAQGNILAVSYGPMNYMIRMSEKGSAELKNLLKALYNYHLAAKAL